MTPEVKAVILAGGRGSRMRELVTNRQKCMLPVDGKPILEYILDNIQCAFGSANVIIATGYRHEDVQTYFGHGFGNINIQYIHAPQQLETKRRLLLAKDMINGPFLYLAGDVISNPTQLANVAAAYEREKTQGVLGVISGATDHTPTINHALITTGHGHAIEMLYPPTAEWNPNQLREMGIAYYNQEFIYKLTESRPDQTFLSHVISEAIAKGADFAVEKYFDKWYHFEKPNDLDTRVVFDL